MLKVFLTTPLMLRPRLKRGNAQFLTHREKWEKFFGRRKGFFQTPLLKLIFKGAKGKDLDFLGPAPLGGPH